jgi:hemoglobin/transferrin/lactoferrin receptor protein
MVVTAARSRQPLFDLPRSATVLSSRRIVEEVQARTLPEALEEEPGVLVQRTGPGQSSPILRGFTGFRVLHLVDGVRLNNSAFREGPNQYLGTVDALSTERLELVRGPASVLHGSDAVGGVVNVIPVRQAPAERGTEGIWTERRFVYRFASADTSSQIRAEARGTVDDRLGFVVGGTLKFFGDVSGGRHTGVQEDTGFAERDADARFEARLSRELRFVLGVQHVDQIGVPRTHQTVDGVRYRGTIPGTDLRRDLDQRRDLVMLQLHGGEDGADGSFSAGVSWHEQEETRDRVRDGGRRDRQGFEVDTLGLFGRVSAESAVGHLTLGTDYYRDSVDSFRKDFNADGSFRGSSIQGPVADDASYDLAGAYIQDEIEITDAVMLTLGSRASYAALRAHEVEDPVTGERISARDRWFSVVHQGALSAELGEGLRGWASVGQSFRAPNLSDLTRLDSARSGEIETPVDDLRPERFLTYEVGVKAERDAFSGELSCFYTDIRSLITRTPTGNVVDGDDEVTKQNSSGGYVQGVEARSGLALGEGFSVFSAFTWIAGETEEFPAAGQPSRREPLSRMMPVTGLVGVRYDSDDERLFVETKARIVRHQERLSSRDEADTGRIPPGGTPGYTVYEIRGGYRVTEHARLFFGIENLFDKDYRIHGSGLNEPGTNVVLGAEVTF